MVNMAPSQPLTTGLKRMSISDESPSSSLESLLELHIDEEEFDRVIGNVNTYKHVGAKRRRVDSPLAENCKRRQPTVYSGSQQLLPKAILYIAKENIMSQPVFIESKNGFTGFIRAWKIKKDTEMMDKLNNMNSAEVLALFEQFLCTKKTYAKMYISVFADYWATHKRRDQILKLIAICTRESRMLDKLPDVAKALTKAGMNYALAVCEVSNRIKNRSMAWTIILFDMIMDGKNEHWFWFTDTLKAIIDFWRKNNIQDVNRLKRILNNCITLKMSQMEYALMYAVGKYLKGIDAAYHNSIGNELVDKFYNQYMLGFPKGLRLIKM